MSTPIERMKKILALARRGVGGEKATAEAMLEKLLAKYDMSIADLDGDAGLAQRREFKYSTEFDRKLLSQIVASVLGTRSLTSWRRRGKKQVGFDLTTLQFAEVDVRYSAYRGALRKELEKATGRVYAAFVQANNLGVSAGDDDEPADDMDLDELHAILGLMQAMRPTPIHRQIAQGVAAP